jgi:DNA repair photolyase
MSVIYEPKGRALEYSWLACNLYKGCVHGCQYCYAPSALQKRPADFHNTAAPRDNILRELRKDAAKLAGTRKRVLLCFTCDPYPPLDIAGAVTREALLVLREHEISFQVLTKGGMRAARDFDCYGPDDAFATTLTFLDVDRSLSVEPKAAIPSDRIEAIRAAKEAGITTWASLEPVLDAEQSLALIEATRDIVDLYKIGKLNHRTSRNAL